MSTIAHVERRFRELGPWVSRFLIRGLEFGGWYYVERDVRMELFFEAFPRARRVLELGSLEGGHAFTLARAGIEVLGLEGRDYNIAKAEYVRDLLGVEGVRFAEADLETADLRSFGSHDVVLCMGLLYHLARPRRLLNQLSGVAPGVFMWTHYAPDDAEDLIVHDGLEGRWVREHGIGDPLSGLNPGSFWLTLPALTGSLAENGFEVELLHVDPENHGGAGPCVLLAARLSGA